jgi:hypothetical protein
VDDRRLEAGIRRGACRRHATAFRKSRRALKAAVEAARAAAAEAGSAPAPQGNRGFNSEKNNSAPEAGGRRRLVQRLDSGEKIGIGGSMHASCL